MSAKIRDLRMGTPLDNFTLPSTTGEEISLRSYRQRHPLIILIMHTLDCPACHAWLTEMIYHYDTCRNWKIEALAVMPSTLSQAHRLALQLQLDVPFPILADEADEVRKRNEIPSGQAALYVLDRYNALQVRDLADNAANLMLPTEAIEWAQFSETTCPECGVTEWPEDQSSGNNSAFVLMFPRYGLLFPPPRSSGGPPPLALPR